MKTAKPKNDTTSRLPRLLTNGSNGELTPEQVALAADYIWEQEGWPCGQETVANPFGGRKSVLRVASATRRISPLSCGGDREKSVPVLNHIGRSGGMKGEPL